MQALYDLRGQLLDGAYHGFANSSSAISAAAKARVRYNNATGNLEVSLNGAAYGPLATQAYVLTFVGGTIADSTGTPGNATQNTNRGRAAFAIGASTVVITNSNVTSTSCITATLQTVDATLRHVESVVCAAGSFTIRGNDIATATTNVAWRLEV